MILIIFTYDNINMNHLEIKHLRMIRMIAGTNNLTRAARNLGLSQPALSQQLKDIEAKLGTALFLRTHKTMTLTRIGKKLLNQAKSIIEKIETAELEVIKAVNGETGVLKIGVRCMFCYKWLPGVIKQFQTAYPSVELDIGNSLEPEKDLISKTHDIIISTSFPRNPVISSIPLFEDEVLCVTSEDHALSQKKIMEIKDFEGVDMIAMVEKNGPSFYNFFLKDQGIRLRRYMIISHPEAVVDLVEAGLGVAILPRWFITPYTPTKHIHLCSLTSKKAFLEWKASYLNGKDIPHYQEEFIKIITTRSIVQHSRFQKDDRRNGYHNTLNK